MDKNIITVQLDKRTADTVYSFATTPEMADDIINTIDTLTRALLDEDSLQDIPDPELLEHLRMLSMARRVISERAEADIPVAVEPSRSEDSEDGCRTEE